MRRILFCLIIFCSVPLTLSAEMTVSTGLDVGLAVTEDGENTYEAGYSTLNFGVAIERPSWTLSIEAGVPIPPSITIQTPISLRIHPIGRTKTRPFLHLRLRPIYFTLVGCQSCENFLREDQRPPSAYGGTGDAGLGYQFALGKKALLSVGVVYTIGYLFPREVNQVDVPRGVYQGGLFNLGVSFTPY